MPSGKFGAFFTYLKRESHRLYHVPGGSRPNLSPPKSKNTGIREGRMQRQSWKDSHIWKPRREGGRLQKLGKDKSPGSPVGGSRWLSVCTLQSDTSELRAQRLHLLTVLAAWTGATYISKPQSSVFSSVKWDDRTYLIELLQASLLPCGVCVCVVSVFTHILHFPVHFMTPSRPRMLFFLLSLEE